MDKPRCFVKQINTKNLDWIRKAQHSDLYAHRILEHNIVVTSHQLPGQEACCRLEDDRARWMGRRFNGKGRDIEEGGILDGGREGDNIVGCRCCQQKNGGGRTWQRHVETDQGRKRFHRTWACWRLTISPFSQKGDAYRCRRGNKYDATFCSCCAKNDD